MTTGNYEGSPFNTADKVKKLDEQLQKQLAKVGFKL